VYLKVSPMRGLHYFKVRGKLAPRFIRPFKIMKKRGEVAYQLELSLQLSDVHNVFHVSQLKKCLRVPEERVPIKDMDAKEDPSYQEYPIKILDMSKKKLLKTIESRCARCNEVTIPKKKLLGKERKS
jgi:hypothetical protein